MRVQFLRHAVWRPFGSGVKDLHASDCVVWRRDDDNGCKDFRAPPGNFVDSAAAERPSLLESMVRDQERIER
jgi:hypothetical protein